MELLIVIVIVLAVVTKTNSIQIPKQCVKELKPDGLMELRRTLWGTVPHDVTRLIVQDAQLRGRAAFAALTIPDTLREIRLMDAGDITCHDLSELLSVRVVIDGVVCHSGDYTLVTTVTHKAVVSTPLSSTVAAYTTDATTHPHTTVVSTITPSTTSYTTTPSTTSYTTTPSTTTTNPSTTTSSTTSSTTTPSTTTTNPSTTTSSTTSSTTTPSTTTTNPYSTTSSATSSTTTPSTTTTKPATTTTYTTSYTTTPYAMPYTKLTTSPPASVCCICEDTITITISVSVVVDLAVIIGCAIYVRRRRRYRALRLPVDTELAGMGGQQYDDDYEEETVFARPDVSSLPSGTIEEVREGPPLRRSQRQGRGQRLV